MPASVPAAPAWILDVAEDTMSARLRLLEEAMLKAGEDITDGWLRMPPRSS